MTFRLLFVLSFLVFVSLSLMGFVFVTQQVDSAVPIGRYQDQPFDEFAEYVHLLPGNPLPGHLDGCHYDTGAMYGQDNFYCTYDLGGYFFDSVTYYGYHNRIASTTFRVNEGTVLYGHVAQVFGLATTVKSFGGSTSLQTRWNWCGFSTLNAYSFSDSSEGIYFVPIRVLTFSYSYPHSVSKDRCLTVSLDT